MIDRSVLGGVLPVISTPFTDSEIIDEAVLTAELDFAYRAGADGVVMAMVSETLRLSSTERGHLAELLCRLGSSRGVVVISVGAESTRVAEDHARHAQDVGADAVMAIPPVSIATSDDELLKYYGRILGAIDIPVIVQDASGYVGRPISIEVQARLLHEYGQERVQFKPEAEPIGLRVSQLREATNGHARVFEGSGGLMLVDTFRRGVVGTMPGVEVIDALVELWRALNAGEEVRAVRISEPLTALVSMMTSLDAYLAIGKYLLVKRGVFGNAIVRGPVAYWLDEETRREVDRRFERLMSEL